MTLVSQAHGDNLLNGEPLAVRNTSPFVGDRLLPAARSAVTRAGLSIDLGYSISSHFIDESNASEQLFIDGETNDVRLDLRYGITERWDVSLGLRQRQHRDGFLDGLINDWHDFFGMPDGGRSRFPNGVLAYTYTGDALSGMLTREVAGTGDMELATQAVLLSEDALWVSVAAGVEIDSGEPEDLTGSGGTEGFVALRFSGSHLRDLPLVWHGQLGYSHAENTVPLGPIAESGLWFASLSADWRFTDHWSAVVQVDAHTAPFDSSLDALGSPAVMLSLAARWRFREHWSLEAGFAEDIAVETAPDILFFSRLSYRP